MHDDDLTDLAMIAACFQRLVSRAADTASAAYTIALSETTCTSMTALSSVIGASAGQVHERVLELRARSRPSAQVVH